MSEMNEGNERNQKIIDEFRANDGKVGGHFEGKTLLILHTIGGQDRERTHQASGLRPGW